MSDGRYDELCASHVWQVPERYNIAQDVCDKHPRRQAGDGLGELRRHRPRGRRGASCRRWPTRRRTCWPTSAWSGATASPGAAADARGRRGHVRRLEAGRDPALDVGALRGRVDPAPAARLRLEGARYRRRQRPQIRPRLGADHLGARADELAAAPTDVVTCDTAADDPAQLYYTSGTTGLAKGIVHAHRYLLGHEEFLYCHEVRTASGSTAWASGHGRPASRRCSGRGGWARCSASTGARAASTRTSSSPSSAATR